MKAVVFAGPSLIPGDQDRYPEFEFRPPARKGDLIVAARAGAAIIGLVDGEFENAPSVWHKEILFCMNLGILVAGAASMGALRAAECARYGMKGIGKIFEDYQSGRRVSDADVAVLHSPAALRYLALTVALVDIEASIERMRKLKILNAAEGDSIVAAARSIHFKDRNWESLCHRLKTQLAAGEKLAQSLMDHRVNQKREDCLALLEFIVGCTADQDLKKQEFELQKTAFLDGLIRSVET